MKICLITNLYSPYVIGGTEKYVEQIAERLSENNEVIVIATKPFSDLDSLKPSIEKKGGVKIYRFFPLNAYHTYFAKNTSAMKKPLFHFIDLWNPHSYRIIRGILKKEKPDVVHTHNLGGLSLSVFDVVKGLGMPLVHTLHDYALLCPNAMLLRKSGICKKQPLPCRIYKILKRTVSDSKPDIVIAPSQFVLDMHSRNGFFKNSRKAKLPLGIELNGRINKKYGKINILYSGQLSKHKGVHVLIRVFKQIKNSNIRLNITGKGIDESYFKRLARNDKRIIFHGFVSNEKLKELYRISNIFVIPSLWYDNSPVVIYESFANGAAVIGSDIGGIPELIDYGKNGFLFEAGNAYELRNILMSLANNPDKLKRVCKNAFEAGKKYGIKKHVIALEKIYRSLGRPL